MHQPLRHLTEITCVLAVIIVGATVRADEPFPRAAPAESDISADALDLLGEAVNELVVKKAVVGAELHIIKNRKTVFHESYGWADVEEERRLTTGATYCVRSMTKPLTGTAVQMLIDEGKLSLDQRVATILSEFDTPALEKITIQHLLTHTSGLPLTAIRRALTEYKSIREVAADAAQAGLGFEPGTDFQYSDAGSDTLGAIIASVTHSPPEDFIVRRIIEPLQMNDAMVDIAKVSSDRNIPSAYSGGSGNWQRHWKRSDAPIYPLFLTSQSLYCTTADYARFLTLWMDGGMSGEKRLLSEDAVLRAFAGGSAMSGYPNGFGNLQLRYCQQWMVYREKDDAQPELFAHSGSDGTHAWAWPQRDLMILFFTQSRGTMAGVELEPVIDRLIIEGDVDGYREQLAVQKTLEKTLRPFEGIYWDEGSETDYYVFSIENNQLVLERPGRARLVAKPTREAGKFVIPGGLKLEFESSSEPYSPAVIMTTPRSTERQLRHQRDASLPKIDDVINKVREAHAIDLLKESGVVKLTGTSKTGLFGRKGKVQYWFDATRSRFEIEIGSSKTAVITRGEKAFVSAAGGPFKPLEGVAALQETVGHPAIHYGGWQSAYPILDVLKQVKLDDREFLLVRAKAPSMPGSTILVDAQTGLINAVKQLQFIPGMGFVGLQSQYSDFREVAGMTMPFHLQTKCASPLIGNMTIQFETHEVGVDATGLFEF